MNRRYVCGTSRPSRRAVLRGAAATGGGLLAASLLGCGGDEVAPEGNGGSGGAAGTAGPAGSTAAASGAPKSGGRMVQAIGTPDSLDPHRDAGFPGVQVVQSVYSNLWKAKLLPGQPLEVHGDLVADYEQSDPLVLRATIHENVTWQDQAPVNGRPFTSEDVRLNFERMATPQPDFGLAPFLSMVSSVDTPDDHTFVVNFSEPYGPFILNQADGWPVVIPHELYEGDDAKTTAVGTGPFFIRETQRGSAIYLDRNPTYFKKDADGNQLPYLDGQDCVIFPDTAARQSAFLTNKLHIHGVNPTQLSQVQGEIPEVQFTDHLGALFLYELQAETPPLDDVRVRQAIQLATDYELTRDVGYRGKAVAPAQYLSVSTTGFTLEESELPTRNVAEASKLLQAAGLSDGFTIENWIPNNYNVDVGHSQLQVALAEVGIQMEFRITDWTPWRVDGYGTGNGM